MYDALPLGVVGDEPVDHPQRYVRPPLCDVDDCLDVFRDAVEPPEGNHEQLVVLLHGALAARFGLLATPKKPFTFAASLNRK